MDDSVAQALMEVLDFQKGQIQMNDELKVEIVNLLLVSAQILNRLTVLEDQHHALHDLFDVKAAFDGTTIEDLREEIVRLQGDNAEMLSRIDWLDARILALETR